MGALAGDSVIRQVQGRRRPENLGTVGRVAETVLTGGNYLTPDPTGAIIQEFVLDALTD